MIDGYNLNNAAYVVVATVAPVVAWVYARSAIKLFRVGDPNWLAVGIAVGFAGSTAFATMWAFWRLFFPFSGIAGQWYASVLDTAILWTIVFAGLFHLQEYARAKGWRWYQLRWVLPATGVYWLAVYLAILALGLGVA